MKRSAVFIFLLVASAAVLAAHPHVWIDGRVELRLNGNSVEAVRAFWVFDPFFTEMIVLDFGPASNGRFSNAQVDRIRADAFDNLRHYGYFIRIEVDGKALAPSSVERFDVRINSDNLLEYSFEVPLNVRIGAPSTTVKVSMYDETYFTDIVFVEQYAQVVGEGRLRYRKQLLRERHTVAIWGAMTRETVEFVFERE